MKANEFPEKIYLTTFGYPICEPYPEESSCPDTVWSTRPYSDSDSDSIEYIRTDAFIEKACEWIKTNMDDYIHVVYDTVTGMPTDEAYIADKIVVEDFTNYIKSKFETKSYERTKI